MTFAYAKAQRDLSCVYSLGVYLPEDVNDRPRRIVIRVRRPGMRAIHPGLYRPRTEEQRNESLLRASYLVPDAFHRGIIRAHLFPLRPASAAEWNATLVVSFPVPPSDFTGPHVTRDFGAVIHRDSEVAHRFSRRIQFAATENNAGEERRITFMEPVRLAPGTYTVTAVLADPRAADPDALRTTVELPDIPAKELFLVGPILGRRAGPNLVVRGAAGDDEVSGGLSFEPLLVRQIPEPADLVAVTQACYVGAKKPKARGRKPSGDVDRALRREGGPEVGTLVPVPLALEGDGPVYCQNLVDVIPGEALPGGGYEYTVRYDPGKKRDPVRGAVRFAVEGGGENQQARPVEDGPRPR